MQFFVAFLKFSVNNFPIQNPSFFVEFLWKFLNCGKVIWKSQFILQKIREMSSTIKIYYTNWTIKRKVGWLPEHQTPFSGKCPEWSTQDSDNASHADHAGHADDHHHVYKKKRFGRSSAFVDGFTWHCHLVHWQACNRGLGYMFIHQNPGVRM